MATLLLSVHQDAESLAGFFRRQGYAVSVAHSDDEALSLAQDCQCIILEDLCLCQALRTQQLDMPVIVLTDRATVQDKLDGFEAGADDYVTRPFSLPILKARVDRLVKKVCARQIHRLGALEIDLEQQVIHHPCKTRRLSPSERDLIGRYLHEGQQAAAINIVLQLLWQDAPAGET